MERELQVLRDRRELAQAAAARVAAVWKEAVAQRGLFTLVLAGGSTPRELYALLGSDVSYNSMPWDKLYLFWGDERWVPAADARSNFLMVQETLLHGRSLAPHQLWPISTDTASPDDAAEQYRRDLTTFTARHPATDPEQLGWPVFDLVLLGLGADGHTASLFPGSSALDEQELPVSWVAEPGMEPRVPRITLTFPVFARARQVLFLVCGPGKQPLLDQVLADREASDPFPAARVRAADQLAWFVCDYHPPS